jgi:hypothetical protein
MQVVSECVYRILEGKVKNSARDGWRHLKYAEPIDQEHIYQAEGQPQLQINEDFI